MFALFVSLSASAVFVSIHEERSFLAWMRETNNLYTGDEYHFRLGVFLTTLRYINEHNRAQKTFKLGLNRLSAHTPAEYRALLGYRYSGHPLNHGEGHREDPRSNEAETWWDWQWYSADAEVRDQGDCGACWAFSAIASAESTNAVKQGTLFMLSISNLIDCVTDCQGCDGGDPFTGLDYVRKHQKGRLMKEIDYPYVPKQQACVYDVNKAYGKVVTITQVVSGDEGDLQWQCHHKGPVSTAIDASHPSFQSYSTGVYVEPACKSTLEWLNHNVVVTGYGYESEYEVEKQYFIVKNSWGTDWGEAGYIRMWWLGNNQCGIATNALIAGA